MILDGEEIEEEEDKHVPKEYEGKLDSNYYCRAWNSKRDKYCKARAGKGTDHPGMGRCKFHDGRPVVHGKRSKYRGQLVGDHERSPEERYKNLPVTIQDIYDEQKQDPHFLDVEADIRLARAILTDYIERYEEARESLEEWKAWYWEEYETCPPKVDLLPVEHVVTFLKKVTDIAHKEKKLRLEDAMPLAKFYDIMGKMGKVVERWIMEEGMDPAEKLQRIKDGWLKIEIER